MKLYLSIFKVFLATRLPIAKNETIHVIRRSLSTRLTFHWLAICNDWPISALNEFHVGSSRKNCKRHRPPFCRSNWERFLCPWGSLSCFHCSDLKLCLIWQHDFILKKQVCFSISIYLQQNINLAALLSLKRKL